MSEGGAAGDVVMPSPPLGAGVMTYRGRGGAGGRWRRQSSLEAGTCPPEAARRAETSSGGRNRGSSPVETQHESGADVRMARCP